jgi:uncharacterized membrane protein required for colicin V production
MGLDLALGALVLVAALRGWFKGFVLQAIRLAGLVACVYAAEPIRDQAKPYVLEHLPTIRPDLIDRLLWWCSAVVAYVVLVGLASMIVNLSRRRPLGLAEPNRGDQLAGLLLGAAKGLLAASFVVAGVQKYAMGHLKAIPQAHELVAGSQALEWDAQYHPADRVWAMPPVQRLVARVQRGGLNRPPREGKADGPAALQAAIRTPKLQMPAGSTAPGTKGVDPEVAEAVEAIEEALRKLPGSN